MTFLKFPFRGPGAHGLNAIPNRKVFGLALQRPSLLATMNARQLARSCYRQSKRLLHSTPSRHEIMPLQMPAMSPTMTEGGIAGWKKQPGESFIAGDVLLEIETDKATIDVEAQDDGIMGKIITPDGSKAIPVGKIIALLAQEGDDISNLQVPAESSSPQPKRIGSRPASSLPSEPVPAKSHSTSPPSHSRPLFPSDADKIKGTGVRGMLTKGDVLTFLGKASGPMGTYKEPKSELKPSLAGSKKEEVKVLDGAALRQLIVSSRFFMSSLLLHLNVFTGPAPDFDSIIADYLPPIPKSEHKVPVSLLSTAPKSDAAAYFDGLI
ncbi:single hybrid motif-containing protein [Mucidula mucida]|nr:single hybrid motif-containing protein [Mucidula mucida]